MRINLNIMTAFMTIIMVMAALDLAYTHPVIDSESTEIVHLDTEIESEVEVEVALMSSALNRCITTKTFPLSIDTTFYNNYTEINTPPPEQS